MALHPLTPRPAPRLARRLGWFGLGLAAGAGAALLAVAGSRALRSPPAPRRDYSRRSGFPLPADEMRAAARVDFKVPRDLRTPLALRPYTLA